MARPSPPISSIYSQLSWAPSSVDIPAYSPPPEGQPPTRRYFTSPLIPSEDSEEYQIESTLAQLTGSSPRALSASSCSSASRSPTPNSRPPTSFVAGHHRRTSSNSSLSKLEYKDSGRTLSSNHLQHKRKESLLLLPATLAAKNKLLGMSSNTDDFDQLSKDEILQAFQRQFLELEEMKSKINRLEEDQQTFVLENGQMMRELDSARITNGELMSEQARMEEELACRIEVLEKLRNSVRELEREKRDATKRYREQADSFESERHSWYDQEAHYKGRITNLTSATARRTPRSSLASSVKALDGDSVSEAGEESSATGEDSETSTKTESRKKVVSSTPSGPSANEIALQEQLATLSTAHESLTTTLRTVQVELSDLKRVYQDLQEENESYEILLGERTLSGEVRGSELFRKSFSWGEEGGSVSGSEGLGFAGGLESVGEEDDEDSGDDDEEDHQELDDEDVERVLLESQGTGSPNEGAVQTKGSRRANKRAQGRSGTSEEGLGGGLDLAAELEMAQAVDEEEAERKKAKAERRKASEARKSKSAHDRRGSEVMGSQEDMMKEVKALREANKALTLYVSKIVDRVCSQEGFEKVLAVDYRNATPKVSEFPASESSQAEATDGQEVIKFRPSGSRSTSGTSNHASSPSVSNAANKKGGWSETITSVLSSALSRTPNQAGNTPSTMPGTKPLRLTSEGSARKVSIADEMEDEEDIRERERIRQEMARMGITPTAVSPGSSVPNPPVNSSSGGGGNNWIGKMPTGTGSDRSSSARLSVASSISSQGDSASNRSTNTAQTTPPPPKDLDAEVQEVLQLRVVKEKQAKEALEQGKASGFTEPQRRIRPTSIRHPSRSSVSYITGGATPIGVGLGIDSQASTPGGSSPKIGSSSPAPATPTEGEQPAPWGKALRRLSMGWSSPNPPS